MAAQYFIEQLYQSLFNHALLIEVEVVSISFIITENTRTYIFVHISLSTGMNIGQSSSKYCKCSEQKNCNLFQFLSLMVSENTLPFHISPFLFVSIFFLFVRFLFYLMASHSLTQIFIFLSLIYTKAQTCDERETVIPFYINVKQ